MKKNVGSIDTILRYIGGALLIVLGIILAMGTVLKVIFIFLGVMLIGTAIFGFCWLYTLLGVSTKGEKKE
jgi:hypothetical protein